MVNKKDFYIPFSYSITFYHTYYYICQLFLPRKPSFANHQELPREIVLEQMWMSLIFLPISLVSWREVAGAPFTKGGGIYFQCAVQNTLFCNVKHTNHITTNFCTCLKSSAAAACATFCGDHVFIVKIITWNMQRFVVVVLGMGTNPL